MRDHDDKMVCLKCGYELDRVSFLRERKRGEFPYCPICKKELSFKQPELLDELHHPAIPYIIILLIAVFAATAVWGVRRHFSTVDGRKLLRTKASLGQVFFGGETRVRVPGEWETKPYSYEEYWKAKLHSRVDKMIEEEHWYLYDGMAGSEVRVKYRYSDSTGKQGVRYLKVPMARNRAEFHIPAIPYASGSKDTVLEIEESINNEIKVSIKNIKSRPRETSV